jgi:glycosyltransferase involved in cell wall biosynthesis
VSRAPEVTVVIPTRSRWDLLSTAALPSALGQDDVELEVVVVDDGSVDATAEGLAGVADPQLRVIRHERARGVAGARNAGIAAAHGEWVAFLDDDDLWSPRKLRLQLDAAYAAGAAFVYGGAAAVADDRSWLYSLKPADPGVLASTLLSRNVLWGGCSNVMARTDLLRRLGGFDERLFQLADWDLWIRLAHAGRAAACLEVVVGCIVHPRSMLLTSRDDVFEEFKYIEEKHRDATEASGIRFDRSLFTRWVALGHRRAGRRFRAARVYLTGAVANRDPGNVPRALAAVLGERPAAWARAAVGRNETENGPDVEPAWLARYRRNAVASAQATSKASSPTES